MPSRSLVIATADALPFALIGTLVAFLGGRRLAGTGFGLLGAGLAGVALLVGLAAISLARADERPFVLCRTAVNLLWFH
ncbi:hypothetical protein [Haloglomus litoreum]|uniref:hypothetical protein n=1 Tax=Haloglomus litoreum TaxID=3034026 RepID=UPI0023E8216B|nr:hypothetical protein [Haloglomus sp. DT116]